MSPRSGEIITKGATTMRAEALERVKLIFSLFDVDGNGNLEQNDFDLMTEHVIAAAPDADAVSTNNIKVAFRQFWTTVSTELDANHDGKVSFDEFTACVLSPERFDATIAQFAAALSALGDPDGDGLIERPLFVALMRAIGFGQANINALFDAFGADGADRITVAAWDHGIREFYAPDKGGVAVDKLVSASA
jgi:Ca2+-binding EF-hand superfamily protein